MKSGSFHGSRVPSTSPGHDRVEGDVVLRHELRVAHVAGLEPPRFPVARRGIEIGPLLRHAEVFDRRVEPDLEDLVLEAGPIDRHAPMKIASDAPVLQPFIQPLQADRHSHRRPVFLALDPRAKLGRQRRQSKNRWRLSRTSTSVLPEMLDRGAMRSTGSSTRGSSRTDRRGRHRTRSVDRCRRRSGPAGSGRRPASKSGASSVRRSARSLRVCARNTSSARDSAATSCGRSDRTKDGTAGRGPIGSDAAAGRTRRPRARRRWPPVRRASVFVGRAEKEDALAARAQVARVDVGRQHRADQIAEMLDAVDVRQGARDQVPARHPPNARVRDRARAAG